jgi:hypothetical protein
LPASFIWVAFVAWLALASCFVVPDTTFSIQATIFKSARVQAFSVVAGFYDGTLIIRLAASCVEKKRKRGLLKVLLRSQLLKSIFLTFFTYFMGVSNKTWSTDAYGTVVFHLTLCSYATGQCKAWIFTLFVYACKMRRTVGINQALWLRS